MLHLVGFISLLSMMHGTTNIHLSMSNITHFINKQILSYSVTMNLPPILMTDVTLPTW